MGSFLNKLTSIFKEEDKSLVKINADPKNYCKYQVKEVNDSGGLVEDLGLTVERCKLFTKIVNEGFEKHNSIILVAEEASQHVLHPNELFYVGFVIAKKQLENHHR